MSPRITGKPAWTETSVLAAIKDFAATYGHPPSSTDWHKTHARTLGHLDRVERLEDNPGRWPTKGTVLKLFGSWTAAIVAAGFEPGKRGYLRIGEKGLVHSAARNAERPVYKRPAA